mgnify:CR=1 FL=1
MVSHNHWIGSKKDRECDDMVREDVDIEINRDEVLPTILTEGLDEIAEMVFESLLQQYERDNQGDPNNEDKAEQQTENRLKNVLNSIPEDALYEFLVENMTVVMEKGEGEESLREKGKESVFYKHPNGKILVLPQFLDITEEQEAVQKKIVNRIQKKYRNLASLPRGVLVQQMRYIFTNAVSTHVSGKGRTVKETREHLGTIGQKGQRSRVELMDKSLMTNILNKFWLPSSGKNLTFKSVFDDDWNPKEIDLSGVNLKKNMTEDKIRQLTGQIQRYDLQIQNHLEPLVNVLEVTLRNDGVKVEFEADAFIGSYDLKKLNRRQAIYSYWGDINDEYDVFKDKFESFYDALGDVELDEEEFQDNKKIKAIVEILDKLEDDDQLKKKIMNGDLNYIVKFKPLTLQTNFSEDKGWLLFEKMAKEIGIFDDFDAKELADEISNVDARREKQTSLSFGGNDSLQSDEGKTSDYMADTMDTGIDSKGEEKVRGGSLEHEIKQVSEMGILLQELVNVEVDPLYYHAFMKEGAIFKDMVVFANELEEIKSAMLSAGAARELVDGVEVDDDIIDYLEELTKYAAIEGKGGYYLPLQQTTNTFIADLDKDFSMEDVIDAKGDTVRNLGSENEINTRLKDIGKFLSLIAGILDAGKDLTQSASPSIADTEDTSVGPKKNSPKTDKPELGRSPFTSATFLGRDNKENLLEELEDVKEEFDELLEAIIDFFIVPMLGSKVPFDDPIPFEFTNSNALRYFKILGGGKKPDSAFFRAMVMEGRRGPLFIKKNQLETLVKDLEYVTSPGEQKDLPTLLNKFRSLGDTVNYILKLKKRSRLGQQVYAELGHSLSEILDDNNMTWPEDQVFPAKASWGKTPQQWEEEYNKNPNYVWPLGYIVSHIKRNREGYSQNPRTQAKGRDRKQTGANTLIQRFFSAIDDMKLTRSLAELQILETHDNIRKMLGKPVFYNTAKVDNYEHVMTAIRKLDEKYNVEVSAFEIESIVNEIGSMAEIGKKHGIPTEGVYFVKANFR